LVNDSSLLAAAFSRLVDIDGTMLIELPPRRPVGRVYEIYKKYYVNKESSDLFDITIVKATEAVKAGLITADFLKAEKQRLDHYIHSFMKQNCLVLVEIIPYEDIDRAIELGEKYKKLPIYLYISRFSLVINDNKAPNYTSLDICCYYDRRTDLH
jgi:hypothetical protein